MSPELPDIAAVLPHGRSMRLLDRVAWLEPGRVLLAERTVGADEPCFAGLPAGLAPASRPYPCSLVLESFGQAAAVLWSALSGRFAGEHEVLMLAAARDCRFTGRAYPGQTLTHEVRLDHAVADTGFASGRTTVDGREIADVGTLIAVVRPRSPLSDRRSAHVVSDRPPG
jgi:3-hydroxyacyl-[acyl-carrier-protein] dehydratase